MTGRRGQKGREPNPGGLREDWEPGLSLAMLDPGGRLEKAKFKVPRLYPLVPKSGSSEGSHTIPVTKHTTPQDTS